MDQFNPVKRRNIIGVSLILLVFFIFLGYEDKSSLSYYDNPQFPKLNVMVERDKALASLDSSNAINSELKLELSNSASTINNLRGEISYLASTLNTTQSQLDACVA